MSVLRVSLSSLHNALRLRRMSLIRTSLRHVLSSAYSCEIEWENRLKNELLIKVSPDAFFTELSQRYVKKQKVYAVDIDMFANVVTRADQIEELMHLLYKLRRTRRTKDTLESTHHSVCRVFLRFKAMDRLLKILSDRIGYGIFPDKFCYNMIIDQLIEEKNFKDAVKVASLMMLQEYPGNDISKTLALYALNMHLNENFQKSHDSESEAKDESSANIEDDDEVQYVRVPVLRNPYFDDHFDITDPMNILGKTLYFFGKQFDGIIGRSYQLIGLVLYNKWEKAIELINKFKSNDSDAVILEEYYNKISQIISQLSDDSHKEKANQLLQLLNELKNSNKMSSDSMNSLIDAKLKLINDLEKNDIEEMSSLFKEWENMREEALNQQLDLLMREEKKKEIEENKRKIKERERFLFFFENFNRHEIDFVDAEKAINELKAKTKIDEEYIPPEM